MTIDVVCCLDSTYSMAGENIRKHIKGILGCLQAEQFGYTLFHDMPEHTQIRYKLLIFRDFNYSGSKDPIEERPYTASPAEMGKVIDSVEFIGGGDKPESAMEALYYAMRSVTMTDESNNVREVGSLRQVIILFTDSVPLRPEGLRNKSRRMRKNYPAQMPKTLKGLKKKWNEGDPVSLPGYQPGCGRLVICAPFTDISRTRNVLNWYQVTEGLDRTWYVPVDFSQKIPQYEIVDFEQARRMILAQHPDQKEQEDGE